MAEQPREMSMQQELTTARRPLRKRKIS